MIDSYEYGDPGASVVLVQPVDDHDLSFLDDEIRTIQSLTDIPFRLVAVNDS